MNTPEKKLWLVAVPVRIYVQVSADSAEEAEELACEANLNAGDWDFESAEVVGRYDDNGNLSSEVYEEGGDR